MRFKILIILTLTFNLSFGQTDLIGELNKNLIEVGTLSPDSSFDDLNGLFPIVKSKKIIGLGEATHGTQDFFVYKHRLIKYLVTQADYKIFIIEGDFTGSQQMNDYVVNGKGNIYEALLGVGYGIWMKQEFVDLMEWIKNYNSNQELSNKVRFYGCDMNNNVLTARKIKEYLKINDKLNTLTEKGLDWIIERKYHSNYPKSEEDTIKQFVTELDNVFESIGNKANDEYKINEHRKRILEQVVEMLFSSSTERVVLRDKFMAENIEWIYIYENNEKTMFWAHNEHIANNNNKKDQKPIGYYLKKEFNNDYYSLGFGFYIGQNTIYNRKKGEWVINDIPEVLIKKSTDAVFSQCKYPNFILDFAMVNDNLTISEFLNADLYHRAIGAAYYRENNKSRNYEKSRLIDSFDGIVFFRETKAATLMKKDSANPR